jgi:RNA polymerase sigma-70 factor (ECF subfamily)
MHFKNRPTQSADDLPPGPGGGRPSFSEQRSANSITFRAPEPGYSSSLDGSLLDNRSRNNDGMSAPQPTGAGLRAGFQAMSGVPGSPKSTGKAGGDPGPDPESSDFSENGNFDHETAQTPQPSEDASVPEDMATLVLNNPAMGSGPGSRLEPDAASVSSPELASLGIAETHIGQAAVDPTSDAAIMLRVAAGDESGFNYLVAKYHRPMIHFLFRMVRDQAIAEELAQEVFLRVYRSRESYRAEAKFTTWLYRIATNLGVNHARDTKQERSARNVYLDAPDEETGTTPEVADDEPTVEQRLLRDERMAAIRKHVLALPDRQRMAVLMHKYQGLDYREIGDVLKLSESATKSLLFRAYQTLRDKLKDFV